MAAQPHEDTSFDPETPGEVTLAWTRLDRQARDSLGISAADFLNKWVNGRIHMRILDDVDDRSQSQRPSTIRGIQESATDDELPPVVELSADEFDEMYDLRVRAELGISGKEFIRRFNAGEYPDWDPELAYLVMMIPYVSEQSD